MMYAATVDVRTEGVSIREELRSIAQPQNEILARLKAQLFGSEQRVVSGYSRMHNRHNRS